MGQSESVHSSSPGTLGSCSYEIVWLWKAAMNWSELHAGDTSDCRPSLSSPVGDTQPLELCRGSPFSSTSLWAWSWVEQCLVILLKTLLQEIQKQAVLSRDDCMWLLCSRKLKILVLAKNNSKPTAGAIKERSNSDWCVWGLLRQYDHQYLELLWIFHKVAPTYSLHLNFEYRPTSW